MNSISIIIRCKNEEHFIGQTLKEVFEQEIGIPFEVLVIDSGSTDSTLHIVKQYNVRLFSIPAESFTFGYALNYGIKRAEGNIICNLSAHCIPCNNLWLKELLLPITNSSCQATFGRQVAIKGVNPLEEVSLNKQFPENDIITGRAPFSNANCAFLKELWQKRGFDEELPGWEDYLWYLLLKDHYEFRYCPKAAVYHSHPFSIKSTASRAYIDGMAFKKIKKKYNIDLLSHVVYTDLKTRLRIFIEDAKDYIRLCREEGCGLNIFLAAIAKFYSYKAFRDGYMSIK